MRWATRRRAPPSSARWGLRDRAGAGGGPGTRGLTLGGDDHLRAVVGTKARGGGPLLFPDERASDGGRGGLEPSGGGGRGYGLPRGGDVPGGIGLFRGGGLLGYQVPAALPSEPLPQSFRLLPLRLGGRGSGSAPVLRFLTAPIHPSAWRNCLEILRHAPASSPSSGSLPRR